MPATTYAHIEFREGVPHVAGTRTRVRLIAVDHIANGWDAVQIHQHYPYLSLGQIHSALAYYYDHKEAMDAEIAEKERFAEEMRQKQDDTPWLRERLRAKSLLP
jgi:uncharacterized protein (DUF433 family)